jgi:hypothetical protein
MSRSSKKGHGHVWRRWIGILGHSCAEHTSLTASLPSLPYVSVDGGGDNE